MALKVRAMGSTPEEKALIRQEYPFHIPDFVFKAGYIFETFTDKTVLGCYYFLPHSTAHTREPTGKERRLFSLGYHSERQYDTQEMQFPGDMFSVKVYGSRELINNVAYVLKKVYGIPHIPRGMHVSTQYLNVARGLYGHRYMTQAQKQITGKEGYLTFTEDNNPQNITKILTIRDLLKELGEDHPLYEDMLVKGAVYNPELNTKYLSFNNFKHTNRNGKDKKQSNESGSTSVSKQGGKGRNLDLSTFGGRGTGLEKSDRGRRARVISFSSTGRRRGEGLRSSRRINRNAPTP